MRRSVECPILAAVVLSAALSFAQQVFSNVEIHVGNGTVLHHATLHISGEKIGQITNSERGQPSAKIVIIPGLIDAATSMDAGLGFGFERQGPSTPYLRAEDTLETKRKFFAGPAYLGTGTTIVYITPGLWRPISGQGVVLDLSGDSVLDMEMPARQFVHFSVSEQPLFQYGRGPTLPQTHMGEFGVIRSRLYEAKKYLEARKAHNAEPAVPDPELEILADVLEGKRTARIDCDTARDITRAIALADEFHIRPVLDHATEAYRVRELLAKRKFPVIVLPYTQGDVYDLVQEHQILSTPAWLMNHGVPVAFQTFGHGFPPYGNLHEYSEPRSLFIDAVLQIRTGMDPEAVLTAMTRNAAEILGISDRVGTLEAGKWASFVVLDGPPFEYTTHIQEVWIRGHKVFDRAQNDVFVH